MGFQREKGYKAIILEENRKIGLILFVIGAKVISGAVFYEDSYPMGTYITGLIGLFVLGFSFIMLLGKRMHWP